MMSINFNIFYSNQLQPFRKYNPLYPSIINMFPSSSTSLKKLDRSRNLTERMAFTSRSSFGSPSPHATTQVPSLLQTLLQREQKDIHIKSRTHNLEQELQLKRKENRVLEKNVESALEIAKKERVEWSRGKEQVALLTTMQTRQNRTIQKMGSRVGELEELIKRVNAEKEELVEKCNQIVHKQHQLEQVHRQLNHLREQLEAVTKENQELKVLVEDNHNLKDRIKTLQLSLREIRLMNDECNNLVKKVNHEKKLLEEALKKTKPDAERQAERIRYYERVNLDLQRKMDEFNRRENQLLRQIEKVTGQLNRTKDSRDNYKARLQATTKHLNEKTAECEDYTQKYQQKCQDFDQLTLQHQQSVALSQSLSKKLQQTIDFYKQQAAQNKYLLQRNIALQQNQTHIRETLAHIKLVTHHINIEMTKKQSEIKHLKQTNTSLEEKLKELTDMFSKFDGIYNQGTMKGYTELKETVNGIIRASKKLQLDLEDLKGELDEKVLVFGEERDALKRDIEVRQMVLPSDTTCFEAIFADKNQEMRVLENSNLQLLKLKATLEETVEQASKRMIQIQRENDAFKIRVLDLFKLTKQHEELKQREQRYHNMLLQAREQKDNLQEQLSALRDKNQKLYDELFKVQMDCKTKSLTITNLQNILKELDVQTLQAKKALLQKRDLLMNDTIDKFTNAVQSLNIFFKCPYCGRILKEPVTVELCGHSYCYDCTRAYEDDCFECGTGLPIEKTFVNKYLNNAVTKYQFFLLVFAEVEKVFDRKGKSIK